MSEELRESPPASSASYRGLSDESLSALLRDLDREQPRPGFDQAVMRRLSEARQPALRPSVFWRYLALPIAATGALLLGVLAADWRPTPASSRDAAEPPVVADHSTEPTASAFGSAPSAPSTPSASAAVAASAAPPTRATPFVEASQLAHRPARLGSSPGGSSLEPLPSAQAQALLARYQSLSRELDDLRLQAARARPLVAISGPGDQVDFVVDLRQFLVLEGTPMFDPRSPNSAVLESLQAAGSNAASVTPGRRRSPPDGLRW